MAYNSSLGFLSKSVCRSKPKDGRSNRVQCRSIKGEGTCYGPQPHGSSKIISSNHDEYTMERVPNQERNAS